MVENCIERWGPDNIYNEFQWIVANKHLKGKGLYISKEILSQKLLQTSSHHVFSLQTITEFSCKLSPQELLRPW